MYISSSGQPYKYAKQFTAFSASITTRLPCTYPRCTMTFFVDQLAQMAKHSGAPFTPEMARMAAQSLKTMSPEQIQVSGVCVQCRLPFILYGAVYCK